MLRFVVAPRYSPPTILFKSQPGGNTLSVRPWHSWHKADRFFFSLSLSLSLSPCSYVRVYSDACDRHAAASLIPQCQTTTTGEREHAPVSAVGLSQERTDSWRWQWKRSYLSYWGSGCGSSGRIVIIEIAGCQKHGRRRLPAACPPPPVRLFLSAAGDDALQAGYKQGRMQPSGTDHGRGRARRGVEGRFHRGSVGELLASCVMRGPRGFTTRTQHPTSPCTCFRVIFLTVKLGGFRGLSANVVSPSDQLPVLVLCTFIWDKSEDVPNTN